MSDDTTEVLRRVRRIETRLTQFMIASGVTTEHQKPVFKPGTPGRVTVPSRHTPLSEIIAALPERSVGTIELYIGSDMIGSLVLAN